MYIVFEGLIGSGKTTQSKRLVEELKAQFPGKEVIWTREPGGSAIAEAIRLLAQATPFEEQMNPVCDAYLYAAARAQSLRSLVAPILAKGGIVVSDRSFASSIALQGFGQQLGLEKVLEINKAAIEGFMPDMIIELRLDPVVALKRAFDARGDKFESFPADFHARCAEGFKAMSEHPLLKDKWKVIDATGSSEDVYQKILTLVRTSGAVDGD